MKQLRALGFVALAALMAIAVVGATSAMAESTALCTVDPGEGAQEACPAEHLFSHLHAATEAGNKAVFLSSVLNVECDLLYLGNVTSANNLGSPLVISGNFAYSNCTTGCEVAETSTHSQLKLLKLGHETADLSLEWNAKVHCDTFINCTYSGTGLKGIAKGALLPFKEEEFEKQKMSGSGFFCPSETVLDFLIISLEPVYITN